MLPYSSCCFSIQSSYWSTFRCYGSPGEDVIKRHFGESAHAETVISTLVFVPLEQSSSGDSEGTDSFFQEDLNAVQIENIARSDPAFSDRVLSYTFGKMPCSALTKNGSPCKRLAGQKKLPDGTEVVLCHEHLKDAIIAVLEKRIKELGM